MNIKKELMKIHVDSHKSLIFNAQSYAKNRQKILHPIVLRKRPHYLPFDVYFFLRALNRKQSS